MIKAKALIPLFCLTQNSFSLQNGKKYLQIIYLIIVYNDILFLIFLQFKIFPNFFGDFLSDLWVIQKCVVQFLNIWRFSLPQPWSQPLRQEALGPFSKERYFSRPEHQVSVSLLDYCCFYTFFTNKARTYMKTQAYEHTQISGCLSIDTENHALHINSSYSNPAPESSFWPSPLHTCTSLLQQQENWLLLSLVFLPSQPLGMVATLQTLQVTVPLELPAPPIPGTPGLLSHSMGLPDSSVTQNTKYSSQIYLSRL